MQTSFRRARLRLAATALAAALALLAGCVRVEVTGPGTGGSGSGTGGGAGAATKQLGALTVASGGSMRGYSRDRFPHWRETGANCDVRDAVLARDGSQIRRSGCNVVGGRWSSPYDKRTFTGPSGVDIDHVVPLANAWRSGAAGWDDRRRGDFANDVARPELLAVSAASNRAKGDQDPSQWKPTNRGYWCAYAEKWITVKTYWRLSVTLAEKAALSDMLETC